MRQEAIFSSVIELKNLLKWEDNILFLELMLRFVGSMVERTDGVEWRINSNDVFEV